MAAFRAITTALSMAAFQAIPTALSMAAFRAIPTARTPSQRLNLIRSMTQLLLPKSLLSADWTALIRFFGVQSVLSPIYF